MLCFEFFFLKKTNLISLVLSLKEAQPATHLPEPFPSRAHSQEGENVHSFTIPFLRINEVDWPDHPALESAPEPYPR
jgi:hypothetical protein